MKTCLVLEGGALRGIYTAGVLDTLLRENIIVDEIIGVSMGSLMGINYCSNQLERGIRYNLKYCKNKNYISLTSLLKTGDIANKKFCYEEIPDKYDPFDYEAFKKSKTKLICTVTNVDTGKAEYIEIKDADKEREYLRAGASMPGVSNIVEIGKKKYLDGGVADSIPVQEALKRNYDRVIVVCTRPITYRKKDSELKVMQKRYREYPNFQKAIKNRNKHYNEMVEEIIQLEKENKILVIRPTKAIKIKRIEHNPKKIQEQYNLGIEDCKAKLKDIKKFLKI